MHLSNLKSLVYIIPNEDFVPTDSSTKQQSKHLACKQCGNEAEITIQITDFNHHPLEQKIWRVDKCFTEGSSITFQDERKSLARLSAKGSHTACVFLNIGGDFYCDQKRLKQKEQIFRQLDKEIKSHFKIEFVYFCITDNECYDMRKDVSRTSKLVLEKGIDHWMKSAESVLNVWKQFSEKSTKIPHLIKIRFTDSVTRRTGSFLLLDLLQPRFCAPTRTSININSFRNNHQLHQSFQKLCELVEKVSSPDRISEETILNTDSNVLTNILAPYVCGFGKLTLFGYFVKYPKDLYKETSLALDFITMMRNLKCKAFVDYHNANNQEIQSNPLKETEIRQLQETVQLKNVEIKKLQLENDIFKHKIFGRTRKHKPKLATEAAEMNEHCRKGEDFFNNLSLNGQDVENQSLVKDAIIMDLKNQLKYSQVREQQAHSQMIHAMQQLETISTDREKNVQRIKAMAFTRISLLKKEMKDQQTRDQNIIEKQKNELSSLFKNINFLKANITREFEISRKEKQTFRATVKLLKNKLTNG